MEARRWQATALQRFWSRVLAPRSGVGPDGIFGVRKVLGVWRAWRVRYAEPL